MLNIMECNDPLNNILNTTGYGRRGGDNQSGLCWADLFSFKIM